MSPLSDLTYILVYQQCSGYMSPEYAMEGHFSEKSDVYSFGVLVLEIVTGCRNSTFWIEEQSLTLLGYVSEEYQVHLSLSCSRKILCHFSLGHLQV